MAATLARDSTVGPPPAPPEEPGGGGGGPDERGSSRRAAGVALIIVMMASSMVFVAFTCAFATLRSEAETWPGTPLPAILWANTGVLAASGVLVEAARRGLRHNRRRSFNALWTAGTLLGFLFLAGQAVAWRQLIGQGVWLGTSIASAFFYILTASHAAHLLAGLAALAWVNAHALRFQLGPGKRTAVDMSAWFWHFLDALWVFLLAVLHVWG